MNEREKNAEEKRGSQDIVTQQKGIYKIGSEEIISIIIQKSLRLGKSFALWRMPGAAEKNLCVSNEKLQELDELTIEELDPGFVFSPFHPSKKKYFLKADKFYKFAKDENGIPSSDLNDLDLEEIQKPNSIKSSYHFKSKTNFHQNDFEQLVAKGIESMEANQFEKVVLSRFYDAATQEDFNPLKAFDTFCEKYPNAFVSLTSSPEVVTWLGASPEMLVSVDANGKFKTVALAGTQRYQEGTNLKAVAWTQKDIEEQAMVSRYIINCFKKVRVREYEEHGPRTVVAGNLLHLRTDYEVDTKEINFPQMGSVMLKLLHPTSAVCGMPHSPAFEFLQEYEGYDREMYAGYLGPVNIQNETNLFVNLRCMQLYENAVRVYAGAGIIADSIAQKENEEVEMKIQSILKNIQP